MNPLGFFRAYGYYGSIILGSFETGTKPLLLEASGYEIET